MSTGGGGLFGSGGFFGGGGGEGGGGGFGGLGPRGQFGAWPGCGCSSFLMIIAGILLVFSGCLRTMGW